MEGGLRRSCPQQASLSACPMPTRSASPSSQADNDRYNEKNISFSAFIPLRKLRDFPPSKLKKTLSVQKREKKLVEDTGKLHR
ncbi:MAG: hypothetical protein QW314_04290 [Thermoproteota archaeon]